MFFSKCPNCGASAHVPDVTWAPPARPEWVASINRGEVPPISDEAAAQGHCVGDQVVWLNTKSKVYHEKGTLYYGHTKQGAYVCRKEADAAGDHDSKNGK